MRGEGGIKMSLLPLPRGRETHRIFHIFFITTPYALKCCFRARQNRPPKGGGRRGARFHAGFGARDTRRSRLHMYTLPQNSALFAFTFLSPRIRQWLGAGESRSGRPNRSEPEDPSGSRVQMREASKTVRVRCNPGLRCFPFRDRREDRAAALASSSVSRGPSVLPSERASGGYIA